MRWVIKEYKWGDHMDQRASDGSLHRYTGRGPDHDHIVFKDGRIEAVRLGGRDGAKLSKEQLDKINSTSLSGITGVEALK